MLRKQIAIIISLMLYKNLCEGFRFLDKDRISTLCFNDILGLKLLVKQQKQITNVELRAQRTTV